MFFKIIVFHKTLIWQIRLADTVNLKYQYLFFIILKNILNISN